jgi:hypothetical protein
MRIIFIFLLPFLAAPASPKTLQEQFPQAPCVKFLPYGGIRLCDQKHKKLTPAGLKLSITSRVIRPMTIGMRNVVHTFHQAH